MRSDLASNQDNSWAYYDVVVYRGEDPHASLGKQISYYHGYEGGESWSEGSTSTRAYFKLEEPGTYRIGIEADGGTGERGGENGTSTSLNVMVLGVTRRWNGSSRCV